MSCMPFLFRRADAKPFCLQVKSGLHPLGTLYEINDIQRTYQAFGKKAVAMTPSSGVFPMHFPFSRFLSRSSAFLAILALENAYNSSPSTKLRQIIVVYCPLFCERSTTSSHSPPSPTPSCCLHSTSRHWSFSLLLHRTPLSPHTHGLETLKRDHILPTAIIGATGGDKAFGALWRPLESATLFGPLLYTFLPLWHSLTVTSVFI